MGQRNMRCPRQIIDLEIEAGPSLLPPEPYLLLGNIDIPNPNYHPVLSASANTGNLDLRRLPSHNEGHIFHHNQYNNIQHHHPIANLDLAINPPHNPYMFPPMNHSSAEHMPSSSNNRVFGVGLEEYNRTNLENVRGSYKRKNSEGIPGNYYHANAPASSSSLVLQREEPYGPGRGVIDASAFTISDYRGSSGFSITEESQRSVRSRSSGAGLHLDSAMVHHHNQIRQGNYIGRTVQSAHSGWVPQLGNNGSVGSSSWSYGSALPAFHTGFVPSGRSINGGSIELGDMGGEVYQDTTSNRPPVFILSSSAHQHHHHHHPPTHTMRGGQSYSYHSQLPGPSYRHPMNHHLHHGILSSRDGLEPGSRYQRPFPSAGERIHRPLHRISHAPSEGSNSRLRILSSEDVAMLEFSGFYGVGNLIDQHRDMRLDIDDMSYEELLALEERIGDVKTGLSEESISKFLKTSIHVSCAASSSDDQPADVAQDNGNCIICQMEFEDQEKIGKLECGHEYHADCIRKWLLLKNLCPICKAIALSEDKKEG